MIVVSGYLVLTGVNWSWHGWPFLKRYTVNQGCVFPSTYYLVNGRHVAQLRRRRRGRRVCAHTSNTASDNHEKIKMNSWVSYSFLYEYGALLGGPSGHRSSAIKARQYTAYGWSGGNLNWPIRIQQAGKPYCPDFEPQASVFYISLVLSNDHRVLSQCSTRLRLLYLLIRKQS